MINPWEEVSIFDYEAHMKLDEIQQLQTLNMIMKRQIESFPIQSLAILGIAGGNGLEHIDTNQIHMVYGIDINQEYLNVCYSRYGHLAQHLNLQKLDLSDLNTTIPTVDLVIANLLIEYIGVNIFVKHMQKIQPLYVSSVIQKNSTSDFVSKSPYTECFNKISGVHTDVNQDLLIKSMETIHMDLISFDEVLLPNKKAFIQLNFKRQN